MTLPEVKSSIEERTKALQTAKPLLSATSFASTSGAGVMDLMRLAEYITTGHDYLDTHPQTPCEEVEDEAATGDGVENVDQ
jgi:hypothetical protein